MGLGVALAVVAGCGLKLPAVIPPVVPPVVEVPPVIPPAPTRATIGVEVRDDSGAAVAGAAVVVEPGGVTLAPTDERGYTALEVALGEYAVRVAALCCRVVQTDTFTLASNRHVRVTVPRLAPRLVTLAEDPIVKANFGSGRDVDGMNIFTPFLAALWNAGEYERAERWLQLQAGEGLTYLTLALESRPYPGYPLAGFDFTHDLPRFLAFVEWLRLHPAADGGAWRFVIYLSSGDDDRTGLYVEVPRYAAALRPLTPYAVFSMGWETLGAWPAVDVSRWATAIHEAFGDDARQMVHGRKGRVAAASFHGDGTESSCADRGLRWIDYQDGQRPGLGGCVEPDDPWLGDEASSLSSHGMQYVKDFAYQFELGLGTWEPCGRVFSGRYDENNRELLAYPAGCVFNRFDDAIARVARGICTDDYGRGGPCAWDRGLKRFWVWETDTEAAFKNQSTPANAERMANEAAKLCAAYGVVCSWGSGLPSSMRSPKGGR